MSHLTLDWAIVMVHRRTGHGIEWHGRSTFRDSETDDQAARSVAEYTLANNEQAAGTDLRDYRYQVQFTRLD